MIESDGDLHGALLSFLKLAMASNDAVAYRTLHIEECVEVMMERKSHTEPLEPCTFIKQTSQLNTDTDGVYSSKKNQACMNHGYSS